MCLEIIRDPSKSIAGAKKQRNMKKTMTVLIEGALLFAIAAFVIALNSGASEVTLLGAAVSVFVTFVVIDVLLGLVVHVSTTTLGGKGSIFEALTVVSYSMLPIAAGAIVSSVLLLVPFTSGLQLIILALAFAMGIGLFYRSIKELYSTDLITSLVAVSVSILSILMAVYASVGLSLLTNVASLVG